jgi:hypothetical protein
MSFLESLKKRHSVYAIGKDTPLSEEEITELIKEVVKASPSAFNSQSQRVVVLFGEAHDKLWSIVEESLKPLTPEDAFPQTQEKLKGFAAGKGTALFFEDQAVVEDLQNQFELYADVFPVYSEHATAIAQANVWTALANESIGGSLQHYNPVIDEKVAAEWNIPDSWKLRAQLVFGSIIEPAEAKPSIPDEDRFFVYK